MSMTVQIVGDRELVAHFEAMPDKLRTELQVTGAALRYQLESLIKAKLSDDVLHVRSGALRRSIFSDETVTATSVVERVASDSSVKYAAIQEYGGETSPHVIEPVKANALAFLMGGKLVFAKRVNHPGSKIQERSYARSSLAEMKDEIVQGMSAAANRAMQ